MNSFLSGKKNLPVPSLQRASAQATPRAGNANGGPAASRGSASTAPATHANVEIVKEGDKVVRLIVTCTCGERTEIECLYPAGS